VACVSELGAAAATDEQVSSQFSFEAQQRRRQARLDQEGACRGAGERPLLDDGQEVLDLSQFHDE
jgi:hypothetical protein